MAKKTDKLENEDFLAEAREEFDRISDFENDNREMYRKDMNFCYNGDQWPEDIRIKREEEGRPCLTINKLKTFTRQVTNDLRENKPSIKTMPVDDMADKSTARVIDGMIRHIEYNSSADIAYDTGASCAVGGGFGYWRVDIEYPYYDIFSSEIRINAIPNPLTVYGDCDDTGADSSNWNKCFVIDRIRQTEFERLYGEKAQVNWDDNAWRAIKGDWKNKDVITVAEYWVRKMEPCTIQAVIDTKDGRQYVYEREFIEKNIDVQQALQAGRLVAGQSRDSKKPKVTQYLMTGAEVLETTPWAGRYIPIVPIYGDEFWIDGERKIRSLINPAKDSQASYNFWRTAAAELVALAPRAPWVGRKGTFDSDQKRWETANTESHSFLEYDTEPPTRTPIDGGRAVGAISEALSASDDIKATIGLFDASLGARSNETSGKAIMARQREGDTATFHFTDNRNRAIRHTGRIIVDLIPHCYGKAQFARVMGENGQEDQVPIGKPYQVKDEMGRPQQDNGIPVMAIHDLTVGKYDVVIQSGPSYASRREESQAQMTELLRNWPELGMIVGDIVVDGFDWPNAEKIAERLKTYMKQKQGELPPEVQQMIEEGKARIAELEKENEALKNKKDVEWAKVQVDQYDAQTDRIKVGADLVYQLPPINPPGATGQ